MIVRSPASTSFHSQPVYDLSSVPYATLNAAAMDVAFTGYDGCGTGPTCTRVKDPMEYRQGEKVPFDRVRQYKMLLDLDGEWIFVTAVATTLIVSCLCS